MGMNGNQDKTTRKAPSITPEIIPAELLLIPPEELTFENPFITLLANMKRKT
jgi:hypothetical protein